MRSRTAKTVIGLAVALFFATGLTFAESGHVDLIYKGKVGQSLTLAPGKYKVVVAANAPSPKAAFYQNGKLKGAVPVHVVASAQKNNQTEVYYNSPVNNVRAITQIDLNGKRNHIMFKKS